MSSTLVKALGVSFYDGDLAGACKRAAKGGLITAPSGPGLAQDLMGCAEYRRALEMSDLVLADSGLLCLWKKWAERRPLTRISGLVFLKAILKQTAWEKNATFWIMPDPKQASANANWVKKTFGVRLNESAIYIAPKYEKRGPYSIILCFPKLKKSDPILSSFR